MLALVTALELNRMILAASKWKQTDLESAANSSVTYRGSIQVFFFSFVLNKI